MDSDALNLPSNFNLPARLVFKENISLSEIKKQILDYQDNKLSFIPLSAIFMIGETTIAQGKIIQEEGNFFFQIESFHNEGEK